MIRAGILALSLCLTAGACSAYFSTIRIENRSSSKIENIVIRYANKQSVIGDIEAGESDSLRRHFPGEGAPAISFTVNGRNFGRELCYHTATLPFEATIAVTDEDVQIRCH